MKDKQIIFLITFLSLPSLAYADAGTALMYAPMVHFFLNIPIAVLEGFVITLLFRLRWRKIVVVIGIMLLANYFSAFTGIFIVKWLRNSVSPLILGQTPLYRISSTLWILSGITFLLTIILEWPFCYWILRDKEKRLKKSFSASLIAQVVSYALLAHLYLSASVFPSVEINIDRTLSFASDTKSSIYFISAKDNGVYHIRPDGSSLQKVFDTDKVTSYQTTLNNSKKTSSGIRLVTDLRSEAARDWEIWTGYWTGIEAKNKRTGYRLHIAIETPFFVWPARNITILPGNQVVFQLGEQIVICDLNSRKLGVITLGRDPVVVLDK